MKTKFTTAEAGDALAAASEAIVRSFHWATAAEGHDYWQRVRIRLRELAEEARGKQSCKDEIAALKKRIEELEERC